jgi:putative membrane protein
MKRTIKDYIILILKGIGMGAADVVPGVSGGTIAFISGIYEELIASIKSINVQAMKLLFQGKVSSFWKSINGNFLLSVVMGIGISILSLARLLRFLLDHYPVLVWSFFFGLIIASALFVGKNVKQWNAGVIGSGIAGIIVAYFVTVITPAEANTASWFIFLSGAIAICAMILPGISGSFILVLLGMYRFILDSLSHFDLLVMGIFLAGAIVGIIAFSNVLSWLLKKYHNHTIAVLAGFMVGSLNKIWPWKKTVEYFTDNHGVLKPLVEENVWPGTFEKLSDQHAMPGAAILMAVLGAALIFFFEKTVSGSKKSNAK